MPEQIPGIEARSKPYTRRGQVTVPRHLAKHKMFGVQVNPFKISYRPPNCCVISSYLPRPRNQTLNEAETTLVTEEGGHREHG